MNLLRSILAVLFAIVIANPACCCTVRKADEPAKASHCCGGGGTKKEKEEKPFHESCACAAKNPKQVQDPPVLPGITVVDLPPLLPSTIAIVLPPVPVCELPQPDFFHDTGPPRRRLVMLQRFLI
ncbi:hypothetical protein OKA05_06030 [Luteolibacter arcticus]|uniref:Secreted protein n=1 Tax=Luteolibacter arcticus TaxID=1581411 RepID=A0ABT3GEQ4_9BACT|nr:hypothetical protein [Luteolibacter arcticus]MCW1922103.1 hypothetical protein [Luteolibacter arcticus]